MNTDSDPRLRLGISSCLLGEPVRFDGGHKRDTFLTGELAPFVEWVPVCPEEEAGFGTPREAMRLVDVGGAVRLLTVRSRRDCTDQLTRIAAARVEELARLDLDGYVLKKDSPSCGLARVKIYSDAGMPAKSGRGVFAGALCSALPALPIEEEGRLRDPHIREHFFERIYAYRRVRRLFDSGPRLRDLVEFHSRHKLLLLAHSPVAYSELGRLVARARAIPPAALASDYRQRFMDAVSASVSRGRHVNVLQHMVGYFRRLLSDAARRDIAAAISEYQRGLVPLVLPARLIGHYAQVHDVRYLTAQAYLDPYPRELMLRNAV